MPVTIPENYAGIYVLHMNLHGAGFGAMVLQTLNQIRYCERNNLLPVVNYDADCHSYFYDKQRGENMWEQYFEPLVPPFDYQNLLTLCASPDSPVSIGDLQNLDDNQMLHICEHHTDSIYSFTFADWRDNPPEDLQQWYREQRTKGHQMFSRYIRVKQDIVEKVNDFYSQHFDGHQMLGIHIRGTDLMYAPPVSPAEYFPHVDNWLRRQNRPKIFVATDQAQYLTAFQQRYSELVVGYDSHRSINEIVPVNLKEIPPHKKGEDVLIDTILLSRSEFLLKGASAVGEIALYMNPALRCLDLATDKRFAFGQDYGKGWNGVLLSQTKPAWYLLKDKDLLKENKNAKSQTRLQAYLYKYRPYFSPVAIFIHRVLRYLLRQLRKK